MKEFIKGLSPEQIKTAQTVSPAVAAFIAKSEAERLKTKTQLNQTSK